MSGVAGSTPLLRLRGSTWAHTRGHAPLEALREPPGLGVSVNWVARSLKDFGEMPITQLAADYDLLVIDHPCVGEGAREGLLLPLDDLVGRAVIADQAAHSVGPSWDSYLVEGRAYALPIDAAGHVSAQRADLLPQPPPSTWTEALAFAEATACGGPRVALPLASTDVWCLFLTLLASTGTPLFSGPGAIADRGRVVEVLEFLHRIARLVHPESPDWNPIHLLDRMAGSDEIAYVPVLFGYSNYAQDGYAANPIVFQGVPGWNDGPARPLLGGAGIAVSASCREPEKAAAVAAYLCSSTVQAGEYFRTGGQPGHRAAWLDPRCNAASRDFFARTLPSLDTGYLRPRVPGFTPYQEQAGELLRDLVVLGDDTTRAADLLDEQWQALEEEVA